MKETILTFFEGTSPEITVLVISTLPVIELRGALPVALGIYNMSIAKAVSLSILGNMIPAFFLVYFLDYVKQWVSERSEMGKKLFEKIYSRAYKKFITKYEKHGAFALALFVAIPLPVTGAWTASIAAVLLGIKPRLTLPYIFLGLIGAATIVTTLTLGLI